MELIAMNRAGAALPSAVVVYCHECGEPMREVQRTSQGAAAYAWYECTRRGCPGVLLQRQCAMSAVPYDAGQSNTAAFA